MLLRQILQHRLLYSLSPRQRRIRLHDDVPLLKPPNDIGSGEPGVQFVLPDVDRTADAAFLDVLLEFVKVVDTVVGDAD